LNAIADVFGVADSTRVALK